MKLDAQEQKWGVQWFVGAGVFALCLVSFLIWVDNTLTNSDREIKLEQTLKEIRSGQTSLPSMATDARQHSGPAMRSYASVATSAAEAHKAE